MRLILVGMIGLLTASLADADHPSRPMLLHLPPLQETREVVGWIKAQGLALSEGALQVLFCLKDRDGVEVFREKMTCQRGTWQPFQLKPKELNTGFYDFSVTLFEGDAQVAVLKRACNLVPRIIRDDGQKSADESLKPGESLARRQLDQGPAHSPEANLFTYSFAPEPKKKYRGICINKGGGMGDQGVGQGGVCGLSWSVDPQPGA